MKNKTALNILLGLLIAAIMFHIAIMIKIVPYHIAWGGRLQNDTEMYIFESVSIVINLFFVIILLMVGDLVKYKFNRNTIKIVLWFFLILFLLNTIGNLFAKTNFEKIFALVTLLFAWLIWRILKTTNNKI